MNEKISVRDHNIVRCLAGIPQKMLQLHGTENMSEFVLHELCDFNCFNFSKAAYFVNNPDFNCCKGIAGCCAQERYQNAGDVWQKPANFSDHMASAAFNKKVRQMHNVNVPHKIEDMVHSVAEQLGIKNPSYYSWELKHNNRGILVFEHSPENYEQVKPHLSQGLSLLGFCPVF